MSYVARSFDWDLDEGVVKPSRLLAGAGEYHSSVTHP